MAGEPDEQTQVHARLDRAHPLDSELEWTPHDPMYVVEQWIRGIPEPVTV